MDRRPAKSPSRSPHPKKFRKEIVIPNKTDLKNDIKLPSSSGSISKDVLIPKFPIEVIAHIFSFLSLRERLNASLVCQEWHEAGRFSLFSLNEKLVFRGFQNFETQLLFLSKTKRKFLNLEFLQCELKISSNLLSMAEKIHCLSFIDCRLSLKFKIELFTKCINLKEFYYQSKIKYCSDQDGPLKTCFNRKTIDSLVKKQFVNENLKIFRLCAFQTNMTCDNIRSLFRMFPNIQHLTFKLSELSYYYDPSVHKFSFSSVIQEIVSLKHVLEKLKIYCLEPQLLALVPHNFTRLKEITISLPDSISETLILDFFSHQECLERISCSSVNGISFPTSFFQHLIRRCSHLKHLKLKFRVSCYIDLSPEIFRTLVSSKLISLKIYNSDIRSTSDELFTTSNYCLENKTLRVLRIPFLIHHRMQSLFVQCFKNLKFLQLQCFSGSVLESIGQFQKNLKHLNLNLIGHNFFYPNRLIDAAPKWDLNQAENCLSSIAGLERLDLTLEDYSIVFNCKLIPTSVKYLRLHYPSLSEFSSQALKRAILPLKKKNQLEAIHFTSYDYRLTIVDTWLEICCSLKKLRILCLIHPNSFILSASPIDPYDDEIYDDLWECCPSLRRFVHKKPDGRVLFDYDQVEEKMKPIDHRGDLYDMHDFIITGKIADSKIKFEILTSPLK